MKYDTGGGGGGCVVQKKERGLHVFVRCRERSAFEGGRCCYERSRSISFVGGGMLRKKKITEEAGLYLEGLEDFDAVAREVLEV